MKRAKRRFKNEHLIGFLTFLVPWTSHVSYNLLIRIMHKNTEDYKRIQIYWNIVIKTIFKFWCSNMHASLKRHSIIRYQDGSNNYPNFKVVVNIRYFDTSTIWQINNFHVIWKYLCLLSVKKNTRPTNTTWLVVQFFWPIFMILINYQLYQRSEKA